MFRMNLIRQLVRLIRHHHRVIERLLEATV